MGTSHYSTLSSKAPIPENFSSLQLWYVDHRNKKSSSPKLPILNRFELIFAPDFCLWKRSIVNWNFNLGAWKLKFGQKLRLYRKTWNFFFSKGDLLTLAWNGTLRATGEAWKGGLGRAATSHTPFLGQCPPPRGAYYVTALNGLLFHKKSLNGSHFLKVPLNWATVRLSKIFEAGGDGTEKKKKIEKNP